MSDREQIEQSARQDQKAIDDQRRITNSQIERTEDLIKREDQSLIAVKDPLDKIEKLTATIPKTIDNTKAFVKQCDEDISVLD